MAKKKKSQDFQKVRIKVGRKLKRLNETVVDLTRKKIRLPRERDFPERGPADKSPSAVVSDALSSLNSGKSLVQLHSIRSLTCILDPFIKQLSSLSFADCSPLAVQSLSVKSLSALYANLLRLESQQLGLQLGDLSNALIRMCRGTQDPGLSDPLHKLFSHLLKLFGPHSKFLDLLRCFDQCAVALLQRAEFDWIWLGCRLAGLVFHAYCQLLHQSLITQDRHFLVDPVEQLVRSSVFSRTLAHLYSDLAQKPAKDVSRDRLHLLRTTMAYFKQAQYFTHLAFSAPLSHPFLTPLPSTRPSQFHLPLTGYTMGRLEPLTSTQASTPDFSLIDMECRNLLAECPLPVSKRPDAAPISNRQARRATKRLARTHTVSVSVLGGAIFGDLQRTHELTMVRGLLEEGFHLLIELTPEPQETVLQSLFCVVRCLRVIFECKSLPWLLHLSNNSRPDSSSSIHQSLNRFVARLLCLFPINVNQNSLGPDIVTTSAVASSISSSRQKLRRARRKQAKLRGREQRLLNSELQTGQNRETSSLVKSSTRVSPWIHRVNQAVLEMCAAFEFLLHRSGPTVPSLTCWPPSAETVNRVTRYFVTEVANQSPRFLAAWLRSFDIYLLAPVRLQSVSNTVPTSHRTFLAPILQCLGLLLHRLLSAGNFGDLVANPKQHRVIAKCAGLLTAFLTAERFQPAASSDRLPNTAQLAEWNYDEDWIWNHTQDTDRVNIFTNLVSALVKLTETDTPRLWYASPITDHLTDRVTNQIHANLGHPVQLIDNTWASCLDRLIALKFSPALTAVSHNPELLKTLNFRISLQDQLIPLDQLIKQLKITTTSDTAKQFGWLTSGHLPSLSGRYASPTFWRPVQQPSLW